MKMPSDAIIPVEKLTNYLLTPRPQNDKSKFLSQAGFDAATPDLLLVAIRQLTVAQDAFEDGENVYGKFYRVSGPLHGPNGLILSVVTVWLQWKVDATFHFVTMKPWRQ